MNPPASLSLMVREAAEAGDVVRQALARNADALATLGERLRSDPPKMVLTCARGSSDHATLYARYLIEQRLRIPVSSVAPSVVSLAGAPPHDLAGALFVAVSQSGRSPDIVAAAKAAAAAGAHVVAMVNVADSPLADAAALVVPLHAGAERSVAATKSCIASMAVLADMVARWSADQSLSEALSALPQQLADAPDWSAMTEAFVEAQSLFVVSRGPGFGVAHEMALKFKETCAIHAEAFSAAEVEHGPMTIVRDGFPVLMLAPPDRAGPEVAALAGRFAARGAHVLCAGLDATVQGVTGLPVLPDVDPALAPITWLSSFYAATARLSVRRGLDPDRPPFLNKVTETI